MTPQGDLILQCLHEVAAQRRLRAEAPALLLRAQRVKQFQQLRFERTYADMLVNPRYASAIRFFLSDLYGPADFARRDDEFARIVPPLVRLFPHEIVSTVLALAQLHSLSEQLDTELAVTIEETQPLDGVAYGRAWRAVGRQAERARQIDLMLAVGVAMDRHTRSALLRHSLRLMRAPSQAAGLSALQRFLEDGFQTFRTMQAAGPFLDAVGERERALADHLFDGGSVEGDILVP